MAELAGIGSGVTDPAGGRGATPAGRSPAAIAARQQLAAAQARVDADQRAHSPGCVAIDQKGVDRAQAALSQATSSQAGAAASRGSALSITV